MMFENMTMERFVVVTSGHSLLFLRNISAWLPGSVDYTVPSLADDRRCNPALFGHRRSCASYLVRSD